mgnify:CR=1 FL=1
MKKRLLVVFVFILPALLFLNVWQSFRYEQLHDRTLFLYNRQTEKLEENKRTIAGIALLASPSRVGSLAAEELKLAFGYPEPIIYILREAE